VSKVAVQPTDKWNTRWGMTNTEQGFMPTPIALLRGYIRLGITGDEVLFVLHAMAYKWNGSMATPSFDTIASEMGKKRSTVQGYAKHLEQLHLLRRVPRLGKSSALDFAGLSQAIDALIPYQAPNTHPIEPSIDTLSDSSQTPCEKSNTEVEYREVQSITANACTYPAILDHYQRLFYPSAGRPNPKQKEHGRKLMAKLTDEWDETKAIAYLAAWHDHRWEEWRKENPGEEHAPGILWFEKPFRTYFNGGRLPGSTNSGGGKSSGKHGFGPGI